MPSVGSKALPWKPGKANLKIMKMKIIQCKKPLASKEAEKNKAKDIEENEKFLSWALTLNTQLSDKQFTIVQHTPRRKSSDYSTGLLGTVWGTHLPSPGNKPTWKSVSELGTSLLCWLWVISCPQNGWGLTDRHMVTPKICHHKEGSPIL